MIQCKAELSIKPISNYSIIWGPRKNGKEGQSYSQLGNGAGRREKKQAYAGEATKKRPSTCHGHADPLMWTSWEKRRHKGNVHPLPERGAEGWQPDRQ